MVGRPAESWVTGIGYAPPELLRIWGKASQSPKTWVGPTQASKGGMALKIDSLEVPTEADLEQVAKDSRRTGNMQVGLRSLQDFIQDRRIDAKVKSNLDRFYRD